MTDTVEKIDKILISGTGRCGSTFLIKIFSFAGTNTGFDLNNYNNFINKNCNAGMEKPINSWYYILKNPIFILDIEHIIGYANIKYMIIPIRNYEASAKSRVNLGIGAGGLFNATDEKSQIDYYEKNMANYLYKMVKYDINTVFLDFDKFTTDKLYLYNKLKHIFDELNVSFDTYSYAYDLATETSKPN